MSTQPVTTSSPSPLHIETTDLLYLLNVLKNEIKTEINCHAIGSLYSFDPVTITCQITLNYQKILRKRNATNPTPNTYTDVVIPYPILIRVPAIVLGGSNGQITCPLTQGDPCVLLFNDRDMDAWLEVGQTTNPPFSGRLHDLSDGIALFGLNPIQNGLTYYTDGIYLRSSYVQATNNFEVGNGATGNFVSMDGKNVTVVKGIVISIL